MKYFRPQRVSQLIREQLASMFVRELEFEGALVTVTDVVVSDDLEHAKIKISIFPTADTEKILRTMQKMRGHYQHELNYKLNIRPMPEINFVADYGPTNAAIVEKNLLDQ